MAKSDKPLRIKSSRVRISSSRSNDSHSVARRSDDSIHPSAIRHEVAEIYEGRQLQERYNFIDYEFEQEGAYCRARTYLATIGEVVIFGPYVGQIDLRSVNAPHFRDAVLEYLKRRFEAIDQLDDSANGDGYVRIWKRSR